MRIAFRSILLLAMALTTLAFSASVASAQESEVEFIDEETSEPCNPCESLGEGESHLRAMPSGVIISRCDDSIASRTYHDGTGEIEWSAVTDTGPGCTTVNCTVNSAHWAVHDSGELGSGTGHMYMDICIKTGATEMLCTVEVLGEPGGGSHQGEFSFSAPCAGGSRIVEGAGEGLTSDVEAVHHSD